MRKSNSRIEDGATGVTNEYLTQLEGGAIERPLIKLISATLSYHCAAKMCLVVHNVKKIALSQ